MEKIPIPEIINKKKPKYLLNINMWSRSTDSHGLFDYSQDLNKLAHKQYQLPINIPSFYILRNKKNNQCIIKKEFPNNSHIIQKTNLSLQLLVKILINFNLQTKKISLSFISNQQLSLLYHNTNQQSSFIINNNINICKDIPGIVVSQEKDKSGNAKGYLLKIGMIIFFGKVKYIVRQIKKNRDIFMLNQDIKKIHKRLSAINRQQPKDIKSQPIQKSQPSPSINIDHNAQHSQQKPALEQQKIFCRVCYDTSSLSQNRLINPCQCIGSCKYIHVKCLKNWLDMKVVTIIRQYCIITQKINCQICKAYLPMSINIDGFDEQVVLMQRPKQCDYLMLQKLQINSRNIFIFKNLPNQGLSIGRGSTCYIKIIDNTISRKPHAFLQYHDGNFYIFDNKSKFGTLIVEEPFQIQVGKNYKTIQIGRSIIQFFVRKDQGILNDI